MSTPLPPDPDPNHPDPDPDPDPAYRPWASPAWPWSCLLTLPPDPDPNHPDPDPNQPDQCFFSVVILCGDTSILSRTIILESTTAITLPATSQSEGSNDVKHQVLFCRDLYWTLIFLWSNPHSAGPLLFTCSLLLHIQIQQKVKWSFKCLRSSTSTLCPYLIRAMWIQSQSRFIYCSTVLLFYCSTLFIFWSLLHLIGSLCIPLFEDESVLRTVRSFQTHKHVIHWRSLNSNICYECFNV